MGTRLSSAWMRVLAGVLLGLAACLGVLAYMVSAQDQRERDWRSVVGIVANIERDLRKHDAGLWFLVEQGFAPGKPHPELEPTHERMQSDLDRLSHLDGARLIVTHVDISGSVASVDYRIELPGPAANPRDRPAPEGGQFTFTRGRDRWGLSGHRFVERSPPRGSRDSTAIAHSHAPSRESVLSAWLASIAAFLLLLCGVVAWSARTWRRRTAQRSPAPRPAGPHGEDSGGSP